MVKTKEELMQLKNEYESLNNKLQNLSKEELDEIVGGYVSSDEYGTRPSTQEPIIHGLEIIGPYAVGGIPLDSDSKLKS